jgi:hypothetical protein
MSFNPLRVLTTHILGHILGFLAVIALGCFIGYPLIERGGWTEQLKTGYLAVMFSIATLVGVILSSLLMTRIRREHPQIKNSSILVFVNVGWFLILFGMLQELFQWGR